MFLRKILADGKVKLAKRITGARPFGICQQAIDAMLGAKAAEDATAKAVPPSGGKIAS